MKKMKTWGIGGTLAASVVLTPFAAAADDDIPERITRPHLREVTKDANDILDSRGRGLLRNRLQKVDKKVSDEFEKARKELFDDLKDTMDAHREGKVRDDVLKDHFEDYKRDIQKLNDDLPAKRKAALEELVDDLNTEGKDLKKRADDYDAQADKAKGKAKTRARRLATGARNASRRRGQMGRVMGRVMRVPGAKWGTAFAIIAAFQGLLEADVLTERGSIIRRVYWAVRDKDCVDIRRLHQQLNKGGLDAQLISYLGQKLKSGLQVAHIVARVKSIVAKAKSDCDKRAKAAQKCSFDHETFDEWVLSVSPEPVAVASATPLYRFWNGHIADHFYTTNREEGFGAWGYGFERVEGFVLTDEQEGSKPLYRYWSPAWTDHAYTSNWDELGHGGWGWGLEGTEGHVLSEQAPGTLPLYRYWASFGDHFYTTNWDDLGYGAHGWNFREVVGYVYSDRPVLLDLASDFLGVPPAAVAECGMEQSGDLISTHLDTYVSEPVEEFEECQEIRGELICMEEILNGLEAFLEAEEEVSDADEEPTGEDMESVNLDAVDTDATHRGELGEGDRDWVRDFWSRGARSEED